MDVTLGCASYLTSYTATPQKDIPFLKCQNKNRLRGWLVFCLMPSDSEFKWAKPQETGIFPRKSYGASNGKIFTSESQLEKTDVKCSCHLNCLDLFKQFCNSKTIIPPCWSFLHTIWGSLYSKWPKSML